MDTLLTNRAIIIPFVCWAIAQTLKVAIYLARTHHVDLHYFVSGGGWPSSHAAYVCALATVVGYEQGLGSPTFAIAFILATVVMYDAAGVRQAVSRQAIILNGILDEMAKGQPIKPERLRELIGHTPVQVFAGAGVGIAAAWLLAASRFLL